MMRKETLTLLYDGECPFCSREVRWLKRRDRQGDLVLKDISALGFDPGKYGLTMDEVRGSLHAIRENGAVVRGMDAVRAAYETVGLGWLVAPTRLPIARAFFNMGYRLFARYRTAWGNVFAGRRGKRCSTRVG